MSSTQDTNKRYKGDVYFNNDEIVHLRSFVHVDETIASHDERSRFAYMIVSKEEVLKITNDIKNDNAVLDAVEKKYLPYLSKAIEEEKKIVNNSFKLKPNQIKIENKLISLISSSSKNSTCEDILLKGNKFFAAANSLPKEKKQKDEKRHIAYIKKSIKDCKTELLKEHASFGRENLKPTQKKPYVLISIPYVYNSIKDNNYNIIEYKLTSYENYFNISLMPKVRVEYGVFFDGTNNNMYNIDFYKGHKDYLTDVVEYLQNNKLPFNHRGQSRNVEDYPTFKEYIAKHPNPEKSNPVMNMLRDELIEDIDGNKNIRYFQPSSNLLKNYNNDNASQDANKIFDFAYEIRENITNSESIVEKLWESNEDFSSALGTTKEIHDFIVEKIMPESDESGSYTNGYTNIQRLYDHYQGNDRLNPEANKYSLTRFKVYASGSGTVDPVEAQELKSNALFGLGLGTYSTGVKAHVVYTCNKIAKELAQSGIEYVDELVFDVFGFSRGATEARHFVCSIQKEFELLNNDDNSYSSYTLSINPEKNKNDLFNPFFEKEDGLKTNLFKTYFNPLRDKPKYHPINHRVIGYEKVPEILIENVSFRHVGIGDTVTHHGVFQSNDFEELNLKFDPTKVGSVYHIMAMDEYRFNFDAYSIFDEDYDSHKNIAGKNGNLKELVVPGAHADVGGGYETFGDIESILFHVEVSSAFSNLEQKVKKWNKTYGWLASEYNNVSNIIFKAFSDKPGFYELSAPLNIFNKFNLIYMQRTNLTWFYELVTLKLMHNEAVDKDKQKKEKDRVPFENLLEKYTLKKLKEISPLDFEFLSKVLSTLSSEKALDKETHKKLRQRYLHHSIMAKVANIPDYINKIPKGELYAPRSIYGATGTPFKKLPFLASRLAKSKPNNFNQVVVDE